MSNSSLVSYTRLVSNCTKPRSKKIDAIVVHHMAGNGSLEAIGNRAANPANQFSPNYAIDSNGKIGLYVDEANRSWCSSSGVIDHRAITIEVANDGGKPNWHVSDKAFESLVALCTDICKRNGIKELKYTGDKSGNLHMHKWYAATGCPGPYLGNKFPELAKRVTANLGSAESKPAEAKPAESAAKKSNEEIAAEVWAGKWGAGAARKKALTDAGYDYNAIQALVDKGVGKNGTSTATTSVKKDVETLANEVIRGLWGSGNERRAKLTRAGYDYNKVQARVNELMAGSKPATSTKKTHTVKAGENLTTIAKKYGTSWEKIYEKNKKVIGSNPNIIKAGVVLKI